MFEGHEEEMRWTLRESLTQHQPTAGQALLNLAARDRCELRCRARWKTFLPY
jgi:hypothetical protein